MYPKTKQNKNLFNAKLTIDYPPVFWSFFAVFFSKIDLAEKSMEIFPIQFGNARESERGKKFLKAAIVALRGGESYEPYDRSLFAPTWQLVLTCKWHIPTSFPLPKPLLSPSPERAAPVLFFLIFLFHSNNTLQTDAPEEESSLGHTRPRSELSRTSPLRSEGESFSA